MFSAERRNQIAKYVNEQGSVSIPRLSQMFSVSEMTIHRDLRALEHMGVLRKTRGGALASEQYVVPVDYQARLNSQQSKKDAIGRLAAQFINPGETILIDPGTTGLCVARYLRGKKNVTVYTNGPLIVLELAQIPEIEVYCTGGLLSKNTMAFVGPQAEDVIAKIRPDKCFIGAHGFNIDEGVTDPLPMVASVKRKMVEVSQEVFLVVTTDKFGRPSRHLSVPIEAIDVVLSNKDIPEHYCQELNERGIRCILTE